MSRARDIETIRQHVTDPEKITLAESLSDEILSIIAGPGHLSMEDFDALDNNPGAHNLRVIVYRKLVDWATEDADEMQEEVSDFIDSESFVQYPDFLTDETIQKAVKIEHMNNHYRGFEELANEFEITIWGARIDEGGQVEVLLTSNQTRKAYDGHSNHHNFSQEKNGVPPVSYYAYLKRNPAATMYGQNNQLYLSMQAPYPGQYGEAVFIEATIDEDPK